MKVELKIILVPCIIEVKTKEMYAILTTSKICSTNMFTTTTLMKDKQLI